MLGTAREYVKTLAKLLLGRGKRLSYAQQGEDAVLQGMLKWVSHGVYVDVGAYHPTLYSNTYAFYKKGWRGIVIDPNSDMRPLYALLRPRDTFVHTAIGATTEERPYYMFADGSYNGFDEARAHGWKELRGLDIREVRLVSFKPLSHILREQKIEKIDFLNIDVEGLDLEVLRTHDWSVETRVIAIEDDDFDPDKPRESEIYNYLHEKGYVLGGLAGLTLLFSKRTNAAAART